MNIFIIVLLLLIAAEASYLVAAQNKKQIRSGSQPVFVDTSVLIDGRIISVAQSGFITSTLMIPRSVLGELQFLADHGDSDKRARARYGLDVANELRQLDTVKVEIFQDATRAEDGVDNQLLKLAKQYNGSICTIDYNLNKVATVEGIKVLNVNDLAMSLRMAYLPGEKIMLELTSKGHDSHQAVGHLPDGTMVVVEQANQMVGKTIEIEFIRSLQTAAGKMMFARPVVAAKQQATRAERTSGAKRQIFAAPAKQEEQTTDKPRKTSGAKPVSRGRQPQVEAHIQPQEVPRTDKHEHQQPTSQEQQPKQPRKNKNQRRRNNHEDDLINLVNQQKD